MSKGQILIFVNELSYSGVPIYVKNLCNMIEDRYQFEIWSALDGEFREEFEKSGIVVRIIDMEEFPEGKNEQYLNRFEACIVHSAYSYRFYDYVKTVLPSAWYIHEGKLLQELCNLWEELRDSLRTADRLICVSQYAADIVKCLSGNQNVEVINNISFLPGRELRQEKPVCEKIRFIQLGTIEPRKGYDILLDAVRLFSSEERQRFDVNIAGRITENNTVYAEELLEEMETLENVHYLGYITEKEELLRAYTGNDVLVVASRDEASSLTALEAASMGMGLILTDAVGAGYLLGETDALVKSGDVNDLYFAMKRMIENPSLISQIGNTVWENYQKNADHAVFMAQNARIIEELKKEGEERMENLWNVFVTADNVDFHAYETLQSIVKQAGNYVQKIQIVLVLSGNRRKEHAEMKSLEGYGEKVKVFQNDEEDVQCQSVFSNIEGKYFTICRAGTVFSNNYFQTIEKYFEKNKEVSVAIAPLWGENKKRILQNIFYEGERIVDCNKNPEVWVCKADSVVYRKEMAEHMDQFGFGWEDNLKNLYAVLLHKMKYAVLGEKSGCEAVDLNELSKDRECIYGTNEMRKVYLWLSNYSIAKTGKVPLYIQHFIAGGIRERLTDKRKSTELLTETDDIDQNREMLFYIMSFIDDSVIMNMKRLSLEHKIFWLRKKYGETYIEVVATDNNAMLISNHKSREIRYIPLVEYQFAYLREERIKIEGYVTIPLQEAEEPVQVVFTAEEKRYLADMKRNEYPEIILDDEIVYHRKYFAVEIDLKETDSTELVCHMCYKDIQNLIPCTRVSFGRFFPVSGRYKSQYYYDAGWKLTVSEYKLHLEKCDEKQMEACEKRYVEEIKNPEAEMLRRLYWNRDTGKRIWLIWDRDCAANDNGEALFHFLENHPGKQEEYYFVIDGNSKDYRRLKKQSEHVVAVNSSLHKKLFAMADVLIGSQTDSAMWPLHGEIYRDIICRKPFVFLQHGITKNDMSRNYAKYWQNIRLFVTAARPEYECTRQIANYGFEEGMVRLLGFPRYDLLERRMDKVIAVLPTWRKYCVDKAETNGDYELREDFLDSLYYQFYHKLLSDKKLGAVLKQSGYKVVLMQHSIMKQADEYFENTDSVVIADDKITYRDIICRASMLITDYSSVSFDFAYLEKPVLYCQFDKELFYATHTYQEGYFDYERDGFGEVVYDAASAVDVINRYFKRNFKVPEQYRERSVNFYGYRDRENCDRVAKAVREVRVK